MADDLSIRVGRAFFGDFQNLRDVQRLAIPAVLSGDDVLIRAATASGKTEAAVAPIIDRFLRHLGPGGGVVVVVVSPTRALVNDLVRRLEGPLTSLGIRVGVRHGERNQLTWTDPPNVLITTPESFDIEVGRMPDAFGSVRALILDEAHLLYNTQRGMQVAISAERLALALDRSLQVVGLSATIGRADDVWAFFRPGRPVREVTAAGARPMDIQLRVGAHMSDLVRHMELFLDAKVLIFTNSRRVCDDLVDALHRQYPTSDVFAHHSSLARDAREDVEHQFESAAAGICVATSTLELGIDIGAIDLVVIWGAPATWQSLAQRLGRGNRRTGRVDALLYSPADEDSTILDDFGFQALLLQMDEPTLTSERPREVYGAVAQQFASRLVAEDRFRGINVLRRPLDAWNHLTEDRAIRILEELADREVLVAHPAYRKYGPGPEAHELERTWDLWSNFAGRGREADVRVGATPVGRISASDARRFQAGDRFNLGGRRWQVVRGNGFEVEVRPTSGAPNVELRFSSGRPELDPLLPEAVRRAMREPVNTRAQVRPVSDASRLATGAADLAPLCADDVLPMGHDGQRYLYATFAGRTLNRTLATWTGDRDPIVGEILLGTNERVYWDKLPSSMRELAGLADGIAAERTRFQAMLPPSLLDLEMRSAVCSRYGFDDVLGRLRAAGLVQVHADLLLRLA